MAEVAAEVAVARAVSKWFADANGKTHWQALGSGHIHDTFLVTHPGGQSAGGQSAGGQSAGGQYVLQAINEFVFQDAQQVMAQTQRLLAHWQQQSRYRVAGLVRSANGAVTERVAGRLWRMWEYIPDSQVVEPITDPAQAKAAGSAFGYFQRHMASLPGPHFEDNIAGFLQLNHYLHAYEQVAANAPARLHRLIEQHRGLAEQFQQRNTCIHGDCKTNNLLFAADGKQVLAVIDFDTAMFGHWAWDFGDLVRAICTSRGAVDLPYFAACLAGFASQQPRANSGDCVAAPAYVALMLGVRFLTDHLQGDVYFRVHQRGENLHRAAQQLNLCSDFCNQQPQMLDVAQPLLELAAH